MMNGSNYREILKNELENRCQLNSRYSLRAFARYLEMPPSKLSELLAGKKGISEITAKKICRKLGFNNKETEYFCDLVEASDGRSKLKRLLAKKKLEVQEKYKDELRVLQIDAFKLISDWYHFAILELLTFPDFQNNLKWIAKKLDISIHEARAAIERLKRLELLEEKNGKLEVTTTNISTTDGIPSEAIKKFNRQILNKALLALDTQSTDERDFRTLTIGINKKDIPLYKEKLKAFRDEFENFAENSKIKNNPEELYVLSTNFIRLSNQHI